MPRHKRPEKRWKGEDNETEGGREEERNGRRVGKGYGRVGGLKMWPRGPQ